MARETLVIEGIVTTIGDDHQINIAPMGPRVTRNFKQMTLRPFKTSQTFKNLTHHPEGVFHVVDDVLLLAQAAVGRIEPAPLLLMSDHVNGYILRDACRFYAFRVDRIDDSQERAEVDVTIVWEGRILVTRLQLLPREQILQDLHRLEPLVEKTGGQREREAFDFLKTFIETAPATPPQEPQP
jgi:hypothetical protein